MNNYILDRLRADAAHLLALADNESNLQHQGLKGRFRELLIDNMLIPWLPPYCGCGTGMIIAAQNAIRQSTQDDIIIYDRSLVPPVLASSNHAPEGVFLYNSVLARVEVKSTLTRGDAAANYNLGKVPNLHSLIPYSMEARKPVYKCTSADGLRGAHISSAADSGSLFDPMVAIVSGLA